MINTLKVMHVVYQSLPDKTGGSIRTQDILLGQLDAGIEAFVVSSPFQVGFEPCEKKEVIDGVVYYRTGHGVPKYGISENGTGLLGKIYKLIKLPIFARSLIELVKVERPDLLHAHNNFLVGFVSLYIARKYNIPIVYEVRSLWEDRLVGIHSNVVGGLFKVAAKWAEEWVMRRVDHVVCISDGLKKDIYKRVLREASLVGNAINLKKIVRKSFNFGAINKIGYVGNISKIEGLSDLIEVFHEIAGNFPGLSLHIYGDGPELNNLKRNYKYIERLYFYGSFSPSERSAIYDNIDMIVLPRLSLDITNKVTPIKPLEAMAYEKVLLVSDIGGHRELVKQGVTGWYYRPGDKEDMKQKIEYLLEKSRCADERMRLLEVIRGAKSFIETERSWSANAMKYVEIYRRILQ